MWVVYSLGISPHGWRKWRDSRLANLWCTSYMSIHSCPFRLHSNLALNPLCPPPPLPPHHPSVYIHIYEQLSWKIGSPAEQKDTIDISDQGVFDSLQHYIAGETRNTSCISEAYILGFLLRGIYLSSGVSAVLSCGVTFLDKWRFLLLREHTLMSIGMHQRVIGIMVLTSHTFLLTILFQIV